MGLRAESINTVVDVDVPLFQCAHEPSVRVQCHCVSPNSPMIDMDMEGANTFPVGKRRKHTAVGVVGCLGAALQLLEAAITHSDCIPLAVVMEVDIVFKDSS